MSSKANIEVGGQVISHVRQRRSLVQCSAAKIDALLSFPSPVSTSANLGTTEEREEDRDGGTEGVLKKELHKTFKGEEEKDEEGPLTLRERQVGRGLLRPKKLATPSWG